MQFYSICMHTKYEESERDEFRSRRQQRDDRFDISKQCEAYTEKLDGKGMLLLSSALLEKVEFGLIVREAIDLDKYVEQFGRKLSLKIIETTVKEITFAQFLRVLQSAENFDYIPNYDEILNDFGLSDLHQRFNVGKDYVENIISEQNKTAIYSASKRFFTKKSFEEELDRIYKDEKRNKFMGHPVDYLIESDDKLTSRSVSRMLIQALYSVGRLKSKRYAVVSIEPRIGVERHHVLRALYKSSAGGTIVVNAMFKNLEDKNIAYGELELLKNLCKIAREYRRDVLTVICLPRVCNNIKKKIYEEMIGCTFVEIREELASHEEAIEYFKSKAAENKIRCDKNLIAQLENNAAGYLAPELNEMFDVWYGKKLKTTVFSQYKDFEKVDAAIVKEKPKGTAYDELNEMIGLKSAKSVINQALDSYKARKLFKDKGLVADEVAQHMIFTGNPGTAKTTVARLFAQIMKENDIIQTGQIVEVGRGDLVGKYVGWTAPTIQAKFEQASGGVLFIDEAYSLVDDRDGSYGDEAINTIVQEMENRRGNVIVIFAGYPDKMEGFLKKNPGLRSRIAHHVHFEDYNSDELCEIAKLIAKQKGVELDEGAMAKVREIMEQAVLEEDFGNGRFVRNVIEKAKMAQNGRLVHMDIEKVTREDIRHICAEDIEIPKFEAKEVRKIGFVA